MKVIDLLKIMVDDVNVPPKRIKYNDRIFEYKLWIEPNKYAYVEEGTNNTLEEYCCFYDLTDEVEIIEDKKIEKMTASSTNLFNQALVDKINEIIDYINKEK